MALAVCASALILAGTESAAALAFAGEPPTTDDVPHIRNGSTPAKGSRTVHLQELWRAGGDDDEMVFGSVAGATQDRAGNVYLLDAQLSQVQVYSFSGEHRKTLSREGEGPGEIRRPDGLLFMPDSSLGAVHFMTGSVVCFDRAGVPGRTITFGGERTRGGMHSLRSLTNRGGILVGCAGQMQVDDGGRARRTEYLASFTPEGKELVRYIEKTTENILGARHQFNEKASYFPSRGGWAVGPDGTVYVAPVRDRYEIHAFDPEGRLLRVIEREFTPRKRTREEKDRVVEGVVMIINGERVKPEATVEDSPPCILDLWVDDHGMLYVEHANSAAGRPEGIMYTLDVFDPQGRYVAQAAIACEGDPSDDELFYLGGDTMALSRGRRSSWLGMFGGSGSHDEGSPSSEVVCYRMPHVAW
jgi:hypothetical protein